MMFKLPVVVAALAMLTSGSAQGQMFPVNSDPEEADQPGSAAAVLEERSERTLLRYRPLYFAYAKPTSKIQFSFRSELSDALPINFAYTQVIFWELHEESKPFLDATYSPELFYRFRPQNSPWVSVDFGLWSHNSNGKSGEESRSFDQTYVRGVYTREWPRVTAAFFAKLKVIYNREDNNNDILKYIGPLDFGVHFFRLLDDFFLDQAELIFEAQPGGKFSTDFEKGGYQISLNFHLDGVEIYPAFYLQYYHGYAESLLNYDSKVNVFRAGITF